MKIKDFQEINKVKGDDLDSKVRIVSILTGKSEDEVESMPINEFLKLSKEVLTKEVSDKYQPFIKVGARKFDAIFTMKELNAGDFIDLTHYTKDQETIINNLHKILAVFYKPRKGLFKKKLMDRDEVAELFLNELEIDVALGYSVFFLKVWKGYIKSIKPYLEKRIKKEMSL